jgi:hypothetical protein
MVKEFCVDECQLYIAQRQLNSDKIQIWKEVSSAPPIEYFLKEWFTKEFA